jgi:hypothetical protein
MDNFFFRARGVARGDDYNELVVEQVLLDEVALWVFGDASDNEIVDAFA